MNNTSLTGLFNRDMTTTDNDLTSFIKPPVGKHRIFVRSYSVDENMQYGTRKLVYKCVITEGEHANTEVSIDFPTMHSNEKVVEISAQNLKKFFAACGKRGGQDVTDVLNTQAVIEIYTTKDKNDPSKEYTRFAFLTADGQPLVYEGATSNPAQTQAQPQETAGTDVPPWAQ